MLNLIIITIYQCVILNILNTLLKKAQIRRISNQQITYCIRYSLNSNNAYLLA